MELKYEIYMWNNIYSYLFISSSRIEDYTLSGVDTPLSTSWNMQWVILILNIYIYSISNMLEHAMSCFNIYIYSSCIA